MKLLSSSSLLLSWAELETVSEAALGASLWEQQARVEAHLVHLARPHSV